MCLCALHYVFSGTLNFYSLSQSSCPCQLTQPGHPSVGRRIY